MATFDKAVRYEVTAVTETPLRTGPSDGSIDRVLRHRDGQAFLQAASLAGALRGWLEKQDKNAANALFGSQEKFGQLIVSDMEIKEKQWNRRRIPRYSFVRACASTAKWGLRQTAANSMWPTLHAAL